MSSKRRTSCSERTRTLMDRSPGHERGGVWGTGRFATFSEKRVHMGETWFPTSLRRWEGAEGERRSCKQALQMGTLGCHQLERERLPTGSRCSARPGPTTTAVTPGVVSNHA